MISIKELVLNKHYQLFIFEIRRDNSMPSFVDKIVKILKEKNYNIVAKDLKMLDSLDKLGSENFLHDIILERCVYSPQDKPFHFARGIWQMNNTNVKANRTLLNELVCQPIAEINKAKIYDFLWTVTGDFNAAKEAEKYYRKHLENTDEFEFGFMPINRLIYISKKINSKEVTSADREKMIRKVLNEYNNSDHGKILSLLKTAYEEAVDTEYLLQYTERILSSYADNSYDFQIIGEFCDLLEQLYYRKNSWKKEKCITEPELIRIRKRKVKAIIMASDYAFSSNTGDILRKVHYLKDAINILKTISGTEIERKQLLQEVDLLEKRAVTNMPVFQSSEDNREIVEEIMSHLESLDEKEEVLCYFALFIPLPMKNVLTQTITKTIGGIGDLFPIGVLGKDGKSIAKSRPIKKGDNDIDEGAFQDKLEHRTSEHMSFSSQILVGNTLRYIRSKFIIEERDIREIVEESIIAPKDRKEAYIKGLMSGFSGDFMTALYILIPQVENSIRELAIQCGEPVYNLNENGIEELKTMHAILELDGVKEKLDDDFLLSLKTIFCSKFGFNMRNNIAHGIFSDKDFNSYEALYTWWFILRMCYMFCGKLQIDNRIKVNEKLKKLFEKKK